MNAGILSWLSTMLRLLPAPVQPTKFGSGHWCRIGFELIPVLNQQPPFDAPEVVALRP